MLGDNSKGCVAMQMAGGLSWSHASLATQDVTLPKRALILSAATMGRDWERSSTLSSSQESRTMT
jgi:hypothetical protein